jgi:hypothetical protein
MPNSDNQDGVHNKETRIYSQVVGSGGGAEQTFADVAAAQAWFLTSDALTVYDECATQIQWGLVGNNKLKVTYAFGTKGSGTAEADDWTAQFYSRHNALWNAKKGPFNVTAMTFNEGALDNDEATVTAAGHNFVVGDKVCFDSLGGFSGTEAEGNMNECVQIPVVAVNGDKFQTDVTDNASQSYTSGGTVSKFANNWSKNVCTFATSDDHLF